MPIQQDGKLIVGIDYPALKFLCKKNAENYCFMNKEALGGLDKSLIEQYRENFYTPYYSDRRMLIKRKQLPFKYSISLNGFPIYQLLRPANVNLSQKFRI